MLSPRRLAQSRHTARPRPFAAGSARTACRTGAEVSRSRGPRVSGWRATDRPRGYGVQPRRRTDGSAVRPRRACFDELRVVEHCQGLQRSRGRFAFGEAKLAGRASKAVIVGGGLLGPARRCTCSPVKSFALRRVVTLAGARFLPQSGGLIGKDTGATDLGHQQTAGRQGGIAQLLGGQSLPRPASQQAILRIGAIECGCAARWTADKWPTARSVGKGDADPSRCRRSRASQSNSSG